MQEKLMEICERAAAQRLPRWSELPDLELYMDQVLSLIERYLRSYPGFDGKGLTASMVNNYVKLGVMPAPVKKKYTRVHLAYLIVICVLKASLPIDSIRGLTAGLSPDGEEESFYDRFCEQFEDAVNAAADAARERIVMPAQERAPFSPICCAALRAQAEQALALKFCEAAFGTERKKEKRREHTAPRGS